MTETHQAQAPPATCGIALKEWVGICGALAAGRQAILLRKGGVAEDAGAFRPEHPAFWLYPTRTHEAEQGLKSEFQRYDHCKLIMDDDQITFRHVGVVAWAGWIDDPARLASLDDRHGWTAETVLKRFAYRRPGLWALATRVFRVPEAFTLPARDEYAGCRSWVELGRALPTRGAVPVLDDESFAAHLRAARGAVGKGRPPAP
jgi:hypothetical protein